MLFAVVAVCRYASDGRVAACFEFRLFILEFVSLFALAKRGNRWNRFEPFIAHSVISKGGFVCLLVYLFFLSMKAAF